jgi:hypothetical protein
MFAGIVQGAAPHSLQMRIHTSSGVSLTSAANSRNELQWDAMRLLISDPNSADYVRGLRLSKLTIRVRCPALIPRVEAVLTSQLACRVRIPVHTGTEGAELAEAPR